MADRKLTPIGFDSAADARVINSNFEITENLIDTNTASINNVDGKVDAEETRAKGVEDTISGNLQTEITRATTAEGNLSTNIATHTTQIANIQTTIGNLSQSISNLQENLADFIGSFNTKADLLAYSGSLTNNDWAVVLDDETHSNQCWQYIYKASTTTWQAEFMINEKPLTQTQWDAVNSGITAALVTQIGTNTTNIAGKQDTLTAGTGIDITNNVISATGGSGSDGACYKYLFRFSDTNPSSGNLEFCYFWLSSTQKFNDATLTGPKNSSEVYNWFKQFLGDENSPYYQSGGWDDERLFFLIEGLINYLPVYGYIDYRGSSNSSKQLHINSIDNVTKFALYADNVTTGGIPSTAKWELINVETKDERITKDIIGRINSYKQDELTAGTGITIDDNNVISATGGSYSYYITFEGQNSGGILVYICFYWVTSSPITTGRFSNVNMGGFIWGNFIKPNGWPGGMLPFYIQESGGTEAYARVMRVSVSGEEINCWGDEGVVTQNLANMAKMNGTFIVKQL